MTLDQIAWAARAVMVTVSAVVSFLLVQTDVALDPTFKVALGAISVALAALNPVTVASKLVNDEAPTD